MIFRMNKIGLRVCKECRSLLMEVDECLFSNFLSICCHTIYKGAFHINTAIDDFEDYGISDLEYLGYVISTEADHQNIILVRPHGIFLETKSNRSGSCKVYTVCVAEGYHEQ